MPSHKERHIMGGMYVDTAKLLTLVHDGLELAEKHKDEEIARLAESVLSGVAIVMRNRVGYIAEPLGDRVLLLEDAVNALTKKKLKKAT